MSGRLFPTVGASAQLNRLPCSAFSKQLKKANARQECDQISKQRPLALILPWLGASAGGIAKYEALYKKHNFDVMVHKASLKDFLWPKAGLQSSLHVLHQLKLKLETNVAECPIVVHSFSVGCYFYAMMILQMRRHQRLFEQVFRSITGQILDSPVLGTLDEMASGVSKMLSPSSLVWSALYRNLCLSYFAVSKPFTVRYYEQGLHSIKFEAPTVTSLMMASENDPLLVPKAFEELADCWRKRGAPLSYKMWKQSEHAQHLRIHPGEYQFFIDDFIKKCLSTPQRFHIASNL